MIDQTNKYHETRIECIPYNTINENAYETNRSFKNQILL